MKYGYARVSTPDQNLSLQLDALQKHGVDKLCKEKISGKTKFKPILDNLIARLKSGDQLIVWKLDRLGRKTSELIKLQESLEERNIALVSITEDIDTSHTMGKFSFQLLCCIAEMERNVISERTVAGLEAAKSKGRIGGRPPGLSEVAKKKAKLAIVEYQKYLRYKKKTISEICINLNISRATFYKYIKLDKI